MGICDVADLRYHFRTHAELIIPGCRPWFPPGVAWLRLDDERPPAAAASDELQASLDMYGKRRTCEDIAQGSHPGSPTSSPDG